ncbi:MAG: hypothetical protein IKO10_16015 [Lachnospiraceae bacterium]|nr:hypothetical protein [Lachnospiraceae bacterium]
MEKVFRDIVDSVTWHLLIAALVILIVWNKTMPQMGYCHLDCYAALGLAFIGALIVKAVRRQFRKE